MRTAPTKPFGNLLKFGYIRGVLEPTMWIMSYEAYALALYDDPALVKAVCDKVAEIHVPMATTLLDMAWT